MRCLFALFKKKDSKPKVVKETPKQTYQLTSRTVVCMAGSLYAVLPPAVKVVPSKPVNKR